MVIWWNLDFLFLIYDHVQDYLVLVSHIVALVDLDFSILETLVIEVFLGKDLGTVEHVGCYLVPLTIPSFCSISSRSLFFNPT